MKSFFIIYRRGGFHQPSPKPTIAHQIKETGFFAVFRRCNDILGKNPVSSHAVFRRCNDIISKTRFPIAHQIKETGFFAVFRRCNDILGKNPVSSHAQNHRNRVFRTLPIPI